MEPKRLVPKSGWSLTREEHEEVAEVVAKVEMEAERQTIVHCTLPRTEDLLFSLIRIWPTTFLVQANGVRKALLFQENITLFPYWMPVRTPHTFTLIFEGLDRDCGIFDLLEEIPQSGGFAVSGIVRNETDVYRVDV